ncbi:MAG: TIGR03943 family putative permease subunit [Eubacteriales bacterium]
MSEIPVYLFTGFLEAGKTKMIQRAMEDSGFNAGEKTLLLTCEEGEEELEPSAFASPNAWLETAEEESSLTPDFFLRLAGKYDMERVIIEYNGVWQLNTLFRALPENWIVYQEIFTADSTTILNYNANMRSLVVDKLQSCDLVVFNRLENEADVLPLHKLVRSVSRRADIEYDYLDGHAEPDQIVDPLPFDINADVIEIADSDYGIWYQDLMDDMEKYDGKTVRFKGIVAIDASFPPNTMAVGRHIMTCCANDIQYGGLICKWKRASSLRARDWVTVTGKISVERHKLYGRVGPVLIATAVIYAQKPDEEVVTFS